MKRNDGILKKVKTILTVLGLIVFGITAYAENTYLNVVVASGSSKNETDIYARKVTELLDPNPAFKTAAAEDGTAVVSRLSGNYFITAVEPFYDSAEAFEVLDAVQKAFPDAYIFTHRNGSRYDFSVRSEESVDTTKSEETPKETVLPSIPKITDDLIYLGIAIVLFVLWLIYYKRRLNKLDDDLKEREQAIESFREQQKAVVENIGEKIRQPARQLVSSSNAIMESELNPGQAEAVNALQQAETLLLDITNDMLDYLGVKSDSVEIKKELFNINNVLDELAGNVRSRCLGTKVELVYDIDKAVPARLIGDPVRLGQILQVLCTFAMKTTTQKTVCLTIEINKKERAGDAIVFTVEGAGVEGGETDALFEPFAEKSENGLSGLGMYIARALAEKMGGNVAVSVKESNNASFAVSLPLDVPDVEEKRQYRLPSKELLDKRILIIDLQPTAAEALKKMLEYFKNSVTVRTRTAIENNEAILFESDMIIVSRDALDDGLKERLRKVKEVPDKKIVLLGNIMEAGDVQANGSSFFDARIMKPLSLQRVYDLIVDLYETQIKTVDTETASPKHTKPTAFRSEGYTEVAETPGIKKASFQAFGGSSILVVEDNRINQKILLNLLQESGIEVEVANDGIEALDALENPDNRFDLVLMDINMPVMDGYEATKHIRADEAYDTLPIVSLTGLGLQEEIAKMYELGMNAHLIKPLQIGKLYTVFKRFLNYGQGQSPATKSAAGPQYGNTAVLAAADGLRMASGNRELYGEILEEFVKAYSNADQSMKVLMRSNDLGGAAKLCRDLRGVGSNIGAVQLSTVCGQMLSALERKDADRFLYLVESFYKALHDVLSEIRKYLP